MGSRSNSHVSAERLQAFLDDALSKRERAGIEEHVSACTRCADELESWRGLFDDLAALPRHAPPDEFRSRVLASLEASADRAHARPLAERFRGSLLARLPSARPAHPSDERLQDFVDGALPARQVARVATHLEGCATCRSEVEAWRSVWVGLSRLEGFAPREGFAERVMAGVRVSSPAAGSAPAKAARSATLLGLRLPDWRRGLAVIGRFVPRTRRAWAALAGIAVTPAVTAGLLLFTVFSHPTLTPQALASFGVWKLSELVAAAWAAVASVALDSAQVLGADTLVRALFDAPFMLVGGALTYSAVTALALRVLYKNLSGNRRHARLSHS